MFTSLKMREALQSNGDSWLEGTIDSEDTTSFESYADYECAGENCSCYVLKDDDEHVVRSNEDPKE